MVSLDEARRRRDLGRLNMAARGYTLVPVAEYGDWCARQGVAVEWVRNGEDRVIGLNVWLPPSGPSLAVEYDQEG